MAMSSSSLVMVVLVKALLRTGLLEADYYESKKRVKNPTLEL
jgi:hypothetical protein